MNIILSHGRGGSPEDPIIKALSATASDRGYAIHAVHDADIQDRPDERVQRLITVVQQYGDTPVILAGFSMGGYSSVAAAEVCQNVRGLFLIAPGLYLPHYGQRRYRTDFINTEVIHGWSDDIVLYEHSLRFARDVGCPLHLIPGSHLLLSQLPRVQEIFAAYLDRTAAKI